MKVGCDPPGSFVSEIFGGDDGRGQYDGGGQQRTGDSYRQSARVQSGGGRGDPYMIRPSKVHFH